MIVVFECELLAAAGPVLRGRTTVVAPARESQGDLHRVEGLADLEGAAPAEPRVTLRQLSCRREAVGLNHGVSGRRVRSAPIADRAVTLHGRRRSHGASSVDDGRSQLPESGAPGFHLLLLLRLGVGHATPVVHEQVVGYVAVLLSARSVVPVRRDRREQSAAGLFRLSPALVSVTITLPTIDTSTLDFEDRLRGDAEADVHDHETDEGDSEPVASSHPLTLLTPLLVALFSMRRGLSLGRRRGFFRSGGWAALAKSRSTVRVVRRTGW